MIPDFKVGKDNQWFRQCVGIDIAKDKFNARLYMYDIASDMGCCTKGVEFPNNKTGFNQLVKWSRKEALKEYPITFQMEPTGVYYEALAYHLYKICKTVYVVLPNKARDFCNYEGIKTKTDDMDSRCLALLGCKNRKLELVLSLGHKRKTGCRILLPHSICVLSGCVLLSITALLPVF